MDRKKNIVLLGVAGVLLVLALLLAFRDAIFSSPPEIGQDVQQSIDAAQQNAEPAPGSPAPGEEPPSSGFSRQARPVERPGGG